jgi:type IV secretory pathway ATPase VirB11/archaellum biosynthesis ATPase
MLALNRPTSWWGWNWDPPVPMSVLELVEAGNFDSRVAAMFWVAMERGASMIVAADPPHSGKTTTVSALLTFTRPDTLVYFTRGVG